MPRGWKLDEAKNVNKHFGSNPITPTGLPLQNNDHPDPKFRPRVQVVGVEVLAELINDRSANLNAIAVDITSLTRRPALH